MSVVMLKKVISNEELVFAKEEYGEYVKLVVDIEKETLTAGGEWLTDGERILLEQGSKQKNLWGGGIDLDSGQVDYISLINTRPGINNSQEVSDITIRDKMFAVINKVFANYVKGG